MTETTNPQPDLRDRIAALFRHPPGVERLGDATPGEIADAVLAVIPAPVDRAAILREAADAVQAHPGAIPYRPQLDEDGGFWWDTRDRDAAANLLRRMADEAQPDTETPCCSDPTCTCDQVNAEGRCDCTRWESSDPSRMADEAQQPETQADDEPTENVIYEVVGDWGVDSADSAEGARAAVAKWLRAYPKCGAYAQQRVYRDWPDGSEFYGPWTDLPDPDAAVSQPGKEG